MHVNMTNTAVHFSQEVVIVVVVYRIIINSIISIEDGFTRVTTIAK